MKISDLDTQSLLAAIGTAIFPIVFEGVDASSPPSEIRERSKLNAEILGRVMGVLLAGDEIDAGIVDVIELSLKHMRTSQGVSFGELLGPGGELSKLHKT
jgi:hypothetical protein